MRVLLTGFEPFGGDDVNASAVAVERAAAGWTDPATGLIAEILPVAFVSGPAALRAALERHQPDALISVGEAGGRAVVTPERWAVNAQMARIPDNDGAQPSGPIDDGPHRLPARLDVDALAEAIAQAGVPAEVSDDAGEFVCNAVFRAALTGFDGPTVFIHVPAWRPDGIAGVGKETDGSAPVDAELGPDDLAKALQAAVEFVAAG